jgi:hypothetical protein
MHQGRLSAENQQAAPEAAALATPVAREAGLSKITIYRPTALTHTAIVSFR